MRKLKHSVITIIVLLTVKALAGHSESQIQAILRTSDSLEKTLSKVVNSNKQIVLLGENHNLGAGDYGYEKLLSNLRVFGFNFDCITLENTMGSQQDLNLITLGRGLTGAQFIEKYGLWGGSKIGEIFEFSKKFNIKMFSIDSGGSLPDLKAALASGDMNKVEEVSKRYSVLERNIHMATKINELLRQGICQRIVHSGGAGHQYDIGSSTPTLTDLLSDRKIVSIILQSSKPIYFMETLLSDALFDKDIKTWSTFENKNFGVVPRNSNIQTPLNTLDAILYFTWK